MNELATKYQKMFHALVNDITHFFEGSTDISYFLMMSFYDPDGYKMLHYTLNDPIEENLIATFHGGTMLYERVIDITHKSYEDALIHQNDSYFGCKFDDEIIDTTFNILIESRMLHLPLPRRYAFCYEGTYQYSEDEAEYMKEVARTHIAHSIDWKYDHRATMATNHVEAIEGRGYMNQMLELLGNHL